MSGLRSKCKVSTERGVLSVARFCYVFPCELRGPAWAEGSYSISHISRRNFPKHYLQNLATDRTPRSVQVSQNLVLPFCSRGEFFRPNGCVKWEENEMPFTFPFSTRFKPTEEYEKPLNYTITGSQTHPPFDQIFRT